MVKKPRRQPEEVLKMEEDRRLAHVAKFACEKCGKEIPVQLWALPEHRITDEVRKESTEQSKEAHRDECKGRMGTTPPMRWFAPLVLAFVLAGCGSHGKLEQSGGTRVDLSQKNYRVVRAGASGEDTGWTIFCILPISSPEFAVAKARLYEGLKVEGRARPGVLSCASGMVVLRQEREDPDRAPA